MKKRYISVLTLSLLASLAACSPTTPADNNGDDNGNDNDTTPAFKINPVISELRKGFTLNGTLKITDTYFEDSDYQVPDTTLTASTTAYNFTLTYQNNDNYMGVDRRFYKVKTNEDGSTYDSYYMGENSYNYGGYAALNYLDYDNTVQTGYAIDSNGDLIPYGVNGLLNPFTYIQRNDFDYKDGKFVLSNDKTSLLFTQLFSTLDDYMSDVTFGTREFNFTEDTLTSAHLVSNNIQSTVQDTVANEDDPYHLTYTRHVFEVTLNFSELGTANAKNKIAVEPEKAENEPLKNAIANMIEKEVTVNRRIIPYVDGEYIGEDSCLNIYYMGKDEGIYSQAYTLVDGEGLPTAPQAGDYILKSAKSGAKLSVYQPDTTTGEFSLNSSNFTNLNQQFYYDDVTLPFTWAGILDANIFNKNEDGSYSPTVDNIPYITRDLFMSTFDTFSPIDAGYVNDVKIYVDETKNQISHIDVSYEDLVGYSGTMILTYEDLGDSHPDFNIVFAN